MKKVMKIASTIVLAVGLLAACGDNNENVDTGGGSTTPINNDENNQNDENIDDSDNVNDLEENNEENNEVNENEENNDTEETSGSSENYDDQLGLAIGDTGQLTSNTGTFEITVNDVEILDEFEGEPSALDLLVLFDITLENTGNESFDADDTVNSLELSESEETGGSSQVYLDELDGIEGDLAPGDSISGEMLFDAVEADAYYLKITGGLIASGAVHNEVMWSFERSEAE